MNDANDIERTASRWLLRREEAGWTGDDEQALHGWLNQSMAHKAAFWRLEYGWKEADRVAALGDSDLTRASQWRMPRWGQQAAAAAATIALFGALVTPRYLSVGTLPATMQHYETALGGHRHVVLSDGSRLDLNTASAVRVTMTKSRREIWLDRGEVYFEVAHLADRLFVVHFGGRTITDLGTRFSVRLDRNQQRVSVVEGSVRINDSSRADALPSVVATAGDVVVARGQTMLLAKSSDDALSSTLSWRHGLLVFNAMTLGDAATEFNRYNRRQIEISDPSVAALHVGGTFQAGNADAFARLLHDAYGLHVDFRQDAIEVSS